MLRLQKKGAEVTGAGYWVEGARGNIWAHGEKFWRARGRVLCQFCPCFFWLNFHPLLFLLRGIFIPRFYEGTHET